MTAAPITPAGIDVSRDRPTREPLDLLLRDLRTGVDGLGQREAERRLAVYGPNALPRTRSRTWLADLVRQITHPLALLLWAAAGLALAAGTPVLCWAILGVIAVNAAVAFLQERQAARAVEALAAYLPQQARVVRDGRRRRRPGDQPRARRRAAARGGRPGLGGRPADRGSARRRPVRR